MNRKSLLVLSACLGILCLSSGCLKGTDEVKEDYPFQHLTSHYTEEVPRAIFEGSLYLSSAIVLAAFVKGILNK